MAKVSKKEIEQYYFEKLHRIYNLPQGNITYGDRPDVILSGDRKLGIEITNFFFEHGGNPTSEQIQRKRRQEAVSRAQEAYLADGGKKLDVWFAFNKEAPIRDIDRLSRDLVELIKNIEPMEREIVNPETFAHIPELVSVYLSFEEYVDPRWEANPLFSVPMMRIDSLQAIIDKKETKVGAYAACDAYWLLVVIDGMDAAQEQETSGVDLKVHLKSFEKLLVFNTFGRVLEKNR